MAQSTKQLTRLLVPRWRSRSCGSAGKMAPASHRYGLRLLVDGVLHKAPRHASSTGTKPCVPVLGPTVSGVVAAGCGPRGQAAEGASCSPRCNAAACPFCKQGRCRLRAAVTAHRPLPSALCALIWSDMAPCTGGGGTTTRVHVCTTRPPGQAGCWAHDAPPTTHTHGAAPEP